MKTNNIIKPLIVYKYPDINKTKIYKDNRNKSGIYRWVKIKIGKSYVGSSCNLSRRLTSYFSPVFLIVQFQIIIVLYIELY